MSYGEGNIPNNNRKLIDLLKSSVERGVIIVNVS